MLWLLQGNLTEWKGAKTGPAGSWVLECRAASCFSLIKEAYNPITAENQSLLWFGGSNHWRDIDQTKPYYCSFYYFQDINSFLFQFTMLKWLRFFNNWKSGNIVDSTVNLFWVGSTTTQNFKCSAVLAMFCLLLCVAFFSRSHLFFKIKCEMLLR